jgi:two-component system, OmpR family, sensor kinase
MRDLLADAAHELRTPLAGVSAAGEALLHARPEQREALELLLVGESHRASRLVEGLLELARLDGGAVPLQRRPTDLAALAQAELDRLAMLRPDLGLHRSGAVPPVPADPERVRPVLRNLLDNAARAAGPDGWVAVAVAADGDAVLVDVLDSGPGVAPEQRERVFDRLVRGDRHRGRDGAASGGSGLGLAIARAHAEAHGGSLVCLDPSGFAGTSPAAGRGALFRLRLPRG